MTKNSPVVLCILDGYGLNPNPDGNSVALAKKPNIDHLLSTCPNTTLVTYGEAVGLPEGQMGNSEVGHLNIGAGRVVEQWLLRINNALKGDFLNFHMQYLKFLTNLKKNKVLHLVGLFSDGGVHSHLEHMYLMIERLKKDFLNHDPEAKIYLHLITDGRDTAPYAAGGFIKNLLLNIAAQPNIKIASIIGRFYAMDRDKRWERVQKATEALMKSIGKKTSDPLAELAACHESKITDEFIEPLILEEKSIGPNESVLFWNFREDRMRQLASALCREDFEGLQRDFPLVSKENVLCFTDYDHTLKLPFMFDILEIKNHLGEWVSENGMSQLRVAETEKYPHVTYFFNGGIEKEYKGEDRKLLPSPRDVKTYDQKPEMSAGAVCEAVLEGITSGKYDLIVVNFANCDMVGHTGSVDATIKAVETVDTCVGKIVAALEPIHGKALFIADHGNAELMIDYTTRVAHTAHTKYPVPAIIYGCGDAIIANHNGALRDVAPTVLKMLNLPAPKEMSGKSLY